MRTCSPRPDAPSLGRSPLSVQWASPAIAQVEWILNHWAESRADGPGRPLAMCHQCLTDDTGDEKNRPSYACRSTGRVLASEGCLSHWLLGCQQGLRLGAAFSFRGIGAVRVDIQC